MNIQCPKCRSICETDGEIIVGRRMRCPFCDEKFVYEEWMSQIRTAGRVCFTACPQCGSVFGVDEVYLGTRQKCVNCGREFEIWKYKGIDDVPTPRVITNFPQCECITSDVTSGKSDTLPVEVKKDIPGLADKPEGGSAPKPTNVKPDAALQTKSLKGRRNTQKSWSVYSTAAIESAINDAKGGKNNHQLKDDTTRSHRFTISKTWKRRLAYVRHNIGHWMLGIVFLLAAGFGVAWLIREIKTLPTSVSEPHEPMENFSVPDDPEPTGAIDPILKKYEWERLFMEVKKRFNSECGITGDVEDLINESRHAYCIFDAYKTNKLIYEVTASSSGISSVVALRPDRENESVRVEDFKKRLREEPCVVVAQNGDVRINPKGRYEVPMSGRSFCIKRANTQMFYWGWGVNFVGLDTGTKFSISLRYCAMGRSDSAMLEENIGYSENITWERVAEIIATRLRVRPNDARVEKERPNYCLVVGECSDVQATPPAIVSKPDPSPAVIPSPSTPGYPTITIPPSVHNFIEQEDANLVFDDKGDNTVKIKNTNSGLNNLMVSIDRPHESQWAKERDVFDFEHNAYRTTIAHKSSYTGKVRGSTAKGRTVTVKLEAIFLTRPYVSGMTREKVAEIRTIGEYVLGSPLDNNPTVHNFSFESPEVLEYRYKSHRQNVAYSTYSRNYRSQTGGEAYCGVVVRLWVGGEIKKVKSLPSNREWEKAAMKRYFQLP